MGLREIIHRKFHKSPDKERFELTSLQAVILATGIEFHAEGAPWWWAVDMVNTLEARKEISTFRRGQVYVDLAVLQGAALVQGRIALREDSTRKGLQYRVTDEGKRERSIVDIRKDRKQGSVSKNPIPEAT